MVIGLGRERAASRVVVAGSRALTVAEWHLQWEGPGNRCPEEEFRGSRALDGSTLWAKSVASGAHLGAVQYRRRTIRW